jgi:hypothetical protein
MPYPGLASGAKGCRFDSCRAYSQSHTCWGLVVREVSVLGIACGLPCGLPPASEWGRAREGKTWHRTRGQVAPLPKVGCGDWSPPGSRGRAPAWGGSPPGLRPASLVIRRRRERNFFLLVHDERIRARARTPARLAAGPALARTCNHRSQLARGYKQTYPRKILRTDSCLSVDAGAHSFIHTSWPGPPKSFTRGGLLALTPHAGLFTRRCARFCAPSHVYESIPGRNRPSGRLPGLTETWVSVRVPLVQGSSTYDRGYPRKILRTDPQTYFDMGAGDATSSTSAI